MNVFGKFPKWTLLNLLRELREHIHVLLNIITDLIFDVNTLKKTTFVNINNKLAKLCEFVKSRNDRLCVPVKLSFKTGVRVFCICLND